MNQKQAGFEFKTSKPPIHNNVTPKATPIISLIGAFKNTSFSCLITNLKNLLPAAANLEFSIFSAINR